MLDLSKNINLFNGDCLDTGYYDGWYLHDFYRDFTFVSEESL